MLYLECKSVILCLKIHIWSYKEGVYGTKHFHWVNSCLKIHIWSYKEGVYGTKHFHWVNSCFISQYSQCFYKMTTKARNMKSMRVFDLLTHFYRVEVGHGILGPSYWIWLIVLQKLFDPYEHWGIL